jgi:hypothetical protein
MAAGAVGAPGTPTPFDAAEALLGCLLDELGLRMIEPDRPGRVGGAIFRAPVAACAGLGCSTMVTVEMLRSPRMVPWPVGDGNCVSLNSVEADSRLLWRSSKLTEGRKSNDAVVESVTSSVAPFRPPKEKREWLLADEALSIGASAVDRRMDPIFVGLVLFLPLSRTDKRLADRVTARECWGCLALPAGVVWGGNR